MNILIPMAGFGERFQSAGYNYPKPLIKIFGKTMIEWLIESLTIGKDDKLWFIYKEDLDNYNFEDFIKFKFNGLNLGFIKLRHATKGAAETLYIASKQLKNGPMMSMDCDTFYGEDVITMYKKFKEKNCIFYFEDNQTNPLYSYIKLDGDGKITDIKEKIKISDNANTGIYCFDSPLIYQKYYEKLINDESDTPTSELYISKIYEKMLKEVNIYSIKVNNFHCIGTPFQLQMFSTFKEMKKDSVQIRICFDIDNTLVSYPKKDGDYSTVKPIYKNINLLKFLKSNGCYIILYTARRMKTHSGNVGKIMSDIGEVTMDTLKEFDIPYDELYFGKPYADFYIDDLAINPYIQNVEKEIGIYKRNLNTRYFNSITYHDDYIVKTSEDQKTLSGEIYWYKNKPDGLNRLFPKYIHSDGNSLIIEKIEGITFSYLYANECLTLDNFSMLLDNVSHIHNFLDVNPSNRNQLYNNYSSKLKNRFESNNLIYNDFSDVNKIFNVLFDGLKSYEEEDLAIPGIIHGDVVFSNVLLDIDNNLKFIDMRGLLGDKASIYGDILYDYAKLYQSVIGYDFILNNMKINYDYIRPFIDLFERYILKKFDDKTLFNIKLISNSLIFSMIPLHKNTPKLCNEFYDLINYQLRDNV